VKLVEIIGRQMIPHAMANETEIPDALLETLRQLEYFLLDAWDRVAVIR
jgi:hypothetical protein